MEQLNYNLLFRWFVGPGVDDPVWVPTVFSKNRDGLPEAMSCRNSWLQFCNCRGLGAAFRRGLLG